MGSGPELNKKEKVSNLKYSSLCFWTTDTMCLLLLSPRPPKVILEEEASGEELPALDWSVGNCLHWIVVLFLNCRLIWNDPSQ